MAKSKRYLSERELNIIRGKAMCGHATPNEILSVFGHLDELELQLTYFDNKDYFGTEGWRRQFGLPDAD